MGGHTLLSRARFGVTSSQKDPEGGPEPKFIYYLIKKKYPTEQSELM
jgi:phosphosulfolactate synthase